MFLKKKRTSDNSNSNNYDSDYGDSDQYTHSPNDAAMATSNSLLSPSSSLTKQPFYLRSSNYLYPGKTASEAGTGLLRSKYGKSVDIDDEDIQVNTRHGSRYSSSSCKSN